MSRGWIRTAGHYHSQEAKDAKKIVFPPEYDATKMFWLINRSGAFGARSGLPHVIKEIAAGIFAGHTPRLNADPAAACEYAGEKMSCFTSTNTLKRIAKLLSHGAIFRF